MHRIVSGSQHIGFSATARGQELRGTRTAARHADSGSEYSRFVRLRACVAKCLERGSRCYASRGVPQRLACLRRWVRRPGLLRTPAGKCSNGDWTLLVQHMFSDWHAAGLYIGRGLACPNAAGAVYDDRAPAASVENVVIIRNMLRHGKQPSLDGRKCPAN
ncbi:hypothetical protein CRI93_12980 [Longimonas halophila]|uniref:Uncharacterized protein n=1 Tax=Longimonas halophila TaxID=1469170 RepID=A0A2H3NIR1_9BACT|nr:hypothetical protein CRI93_12980 [Longimonas halophila]